MSIQFVSVKDFGALVNGVTDDTAAVLASIASVRDRKSVV